MSNIDLIVDAMNHLKQEAGSCDSTSYALDCNTQLLELCKIIHYEMEQDRRVKLIEKYQDAIDEDRHSEAEELLRMIREL